MRRINVIALTLVAASMILLMGCKKDSENNPVSYVDGYTVNLTEGKGTSYTGDFFPIREGYVCNYSGSANMKTTVTIPGYSPFQNTTNEPASGMMEVLAIRMIQLSGGPTPLYPIVDRTAMGNQVVDDTSRFFMKDPVAVYIKALKLSTGKYLEVENPVYIKSQLVVGDAWETAPRLDMTKLLENENPASGVTSNLTLNARAKFFVVGKENISLPIGMRNAMRLEQANDISLNGTMISQGITCDINMTAQLAIVYHLIADTGIVHQNVTGPLDMTISAEGQTVTIKIEINNCELKLTSIGGGTIAKISPTPGNSRGFAAPPASLKTQTEEKLWRISQQIVRTLTKNLSL